MSVARERSFTRAASRLNISQSAVSEQIRALEEEIGFALFRRTSRGIEVSERGRTFLYEAERVVDDVLSLTDTAQRLRGGLSDTPSSEWAYGLGVACCANGGAANIIAAAARARTRRFM